MSSTLEWSYEKRDPISYVSACLLGFLVLYFVQFTTMVLNKSDDMEMTAFIESPLTPEIIKPQEPVKKVVEKIEPQRPQEPVLPKQVTSAFATEAPKEVRHQEAPPPVEKPALLQAPILAPPPPAPAQVTASATGIYEAQLRAYLEKIKRYPTSREARLTRPQGAVRVWLEIARSGQFLGAGIMNSSGSNLLDGEALKTLKTGTYPPIPGEAFVGEGSHKFSATLSYTLEPQ